jgi:hypothetical protein
MEGIQSSKGNILAAASSAFGVAGSGNQLLWLMWRPHREHNVRTALLELRSISRQGTLNATPAVTLRQHR